MTLTKAFLAATLTAATILCEQHEVEPATVF